MSQDEFIKRLYSDDVAPRTREVLLARIDSLAIPHYLFEPRFFSRAQFECAQAVASCVLSHDESSGWPLPNIAGDLDCRLSRGDGKGWRYDELAPERDTWTRGLSKIDEKSIEMHSKIFASLSRQKQEDVLHALFDQSEGWLALFWEDLLAEFTESYFAHPYTQLEIGALGMFDGGLPRESARTPKTEAKTQAEETRNV